MTARFCGFPQGSNQEEFHPGKLQRGFHQESTLPPKPFGYLNFEVLKNQRDTLYEHLELLWQRFREWQTDALFQILQLITVLLSSSINLVQIYQKPIDYQVMFFVDAI